MLIFDPDKASLTIYAMRSLGSGVMPIIKCEVMKGMAILIVNENGLEPLLSHQIYE